VSTPEGYCCQNRAFSAESRESRATALGGLERLQRGEIEAGIGTVRDRRAEKR